MLIDFLSILEGFWLPKSTQNRSKINKKSNQKINEFLNRFLIDFLSILVDFGSPRGGPRRAHEATFGGHFGSWSQDGPQTLQDGLQV